jgi:hypothetical protein
VPRLAKLHRTAVDRPQRRDRGRDRRRGQAVGGEPIDQPLDLWQVDLAQPLMPQGRQDPAVEVLAIAPDRARLVQASGAVADDPFCIDTLGYFAGGGLPTCRRSSASADGRSSRFYQSPNLAESLFATNRRCARSYCPEHKPWRPRGRHNAKLRQRTFAIHGRRCADCGRTDVPLEVHHVDGDPTDNAIRNTIPLCVDCHRKATYPDT